VFLAKNKLKELHGVALNSDLTGISQTSISVSGIYQIKVHICEY